MQEVTIGPNEGTLCTKREGEGTPKTTLPTLPLLWRVCVLCGKRLLLDTTGLFLYLENNKNLKIMSAN